MTKAYSGWSPLQTQFSLESDQDRRQFPRVGFQAEASLSSATDTGTEDARIVNLSEGGAFVCTSHPHPVGDVLRVRFRLPSESKLECTVKVCSRATGRGNGVAFYNLATDQRFSIEAWVERQDSGARSAKHESHDLYTY